MREDSNIASDLALVGRASAVQRILKMVTHLTGMRFSAVARVTDSLWMACAVNDEIQFGLKPGDELVLNTTICDEIRQHHKTVVFGHASADLHWSKHHTPLKYGLESYISIPIFLARIASFSARCAQSTLCLRT